MQDSVDKQNEEKWKWIDEEPPPGWDVNSEHWFDNIEGDEVDNAVEWAIKGGNLKDMY